MCGTTFYAPSKRGDRPFAAWSIETMTADRAITTRHYPPPQIVTKLNGALRKIIDSPETQAQFKNIGFEGFSSTPEELGDFIKAQLALWGKMIKDANIELD